MGIIPGYIVLVSFSRLTIIINSSTNTKDVINTMQPKTMKTIYYYAGRLYTISWITRTKDGVQISIKYLSPIVGGSIIAFPVDIGDPIYVSNQIYSILFNIYSNAIYYPESYSFPTFPELILIISSDSNNITDAAGSGTNSLP
jgi:hypothetical protein